LSCIFIIINFRHNTRAKNTNQAKRLTGQFDLASFSQIFPFVPVSYDFFTLSFSTNMEDRAVKNAARRQPLGKRFESMEKPCLLCTSVPPLILLIYQQKGLFKPPELLFTEHYLNNLC